MAGGGEEARGPALAAILLVAVAAFAILQGGCGGGGAGGGGTTGGGATGRLLVTSDFDDATRSVPGYADQLRVTVTPPAGVVLPGTFPNPFVLTRSGTLRMLDGLEPSAQPYVLDMQALTDGTVVGTLRRTIVITAGQSQEIDVSANLQSAVDSVAVEGVSSLTWVNSQYTAFAKDGQGAALFSGAGFTFTSSNPAVLSIDPDTGLATAKTSGPATVTAVLLGTGLSGQLGVTVDMQTKIAFFSDRDGNYEIYVMNADGSGQTNLTNDPGFDWRPAFSPDGSKIAFESHRDSSYEIYVMNADGSGQTNLTNNAASDQFPAFSPDGSQIAFASDRDGNNEIYVMDADGSGVTRLTFHGFSDWGPAFSPDGSKIAFTSERDGNPEIYVMNADGTGVTNLTNDAGFDTSPAFSPDGLKIAFTSYRDVLGIAQIYIMNADGSGQTRLTNNAEPNYGPSFGPDGSKIAYTCARDHSSTSTLHLTWEICTMNADGTRVTRLTNNVAADASPSFPLRLN